MALADEVSPKLFTSDFSHPESGFVEIYPWEVAGGELRYIGGDPKYDCEYNTFDHLVSSNFHYEIQAAWRDGNLEAGFGVIFRITDDQQMFAFEINRRGCFRYSLIHKKWEITLEDWQQNNAIKQEGFNKLEVFCKGKSVKFYINDVLVSDCPDECNYDKPVKVGVFASYGVKCAFDDFFLQELSVNEK